jgi:putative oxidoreductase
MSIGQTVRELPFASLSVGLGLLRIAMAILFTAHVVVRIAHWTIPQFALFMGNAGFPFSFAWVRGITIVEIIAALLLIANRFVRVATTAFATIAFTGLIPIHRHFGWFVGEHGTGSSEYSVALIFILLLIAAADSETQHSKSGLTLT